MGEVDNIGERSGRGVLIDPNGNLYEGHFDGHKINGNGRMIYTNGRWYEGEWKNGKWHGQGKEVSKDG